jgi:hypothetical protein
MPTDPRCFLSTPGVPDKENHDGTTTRDSLASSS